MLTHFTLWSAKLCVNASIVTVHTGGFGILILSSANYGFGKGWYRSFQWRSMDHLTHWGQNAMTAILQVRFSNTLPWLKFYISMYFDSNVTENCSYGPSDCIVCWYLYALLDLSELNSSWPGLSMNDWVLDSIICCVLASVIVKPIDVNMSHEICIWVFMILSPYDCFIVFVVTLWAASHPVYNIC